MTFPRKQREPDLECSATFKRQKSMLKQPPASNQQCPHFRGEVEVVCSFSYPHLAQVPRHFM